ncbi:hypothetical protein NDU88_009758 [Pleurodeles waltl]|uniref:Uncharacterized protein n=1 Tax=Pleurodeles waltl TaxID=8319 RepID=A0AAV7RYL9_PLEWA|nr:hypothetical protein NDU88_009758 [Pleurodeles waltl]
MLDPTGPVRVGRPNPCTLGLHSGKPTPEHFASPLYYCLVGPLPHLREGSPGLTSASQLPVLQRSGPGSPPRQAVFLLGSKTAGPGPQHRRVVKAPLQAVSPPAAPPQPRAPRPRL